MDLFGYLFGNILAISRADLLTIAVLGTMILLATALFFKELLFIAFDREVAFVSGIPVAFLDHFLLTILALAVVISIKVVGIVLVSALLVIPGVSAAASQITRRYGTMVAASVAIAVLSTVGGLDFVVPVADLASGATIVTLASRVFFHHLCLGSGSPRPEKMITVIP